MVACRLPATQDLQLEGGQELRREFESDLKMIAQKLRDLVPPAK